MKKTIIIILVFVTESVFCQQNFGKVAAFSKLEKDFDSSITLRIVVEENATAILTSDNAISLEQGFNVEDGAIFHVGPGGNINEVKNKSESESFLKVYPNPGTNTVKIDMEGNSIKSIKMMSLEGKLVFESPFVLLPAFELDISSFSEGIYLIKVESTDNRLFTEKFVKK